jgi:transcriptional regulator with PAS, ATPase and Fis domain
MVGYSPRMLELFALIRRAAPHFRVALIRGATGTGKELAAAALHRQSPVAAGPFVVCNCSAITETLFESEMFGHRKGAFTGATHDKPGMFEAAHGGTLFLDELGDLPFAMQSKLLRAIQQQEIRPVGANTPRKISCRVIAATNRDLETMMAAGEFREDLYYRLSMVELHLPPLAAPSSNATPPSTANPSRASPPAPRRSSPATPGPATSANSKTSSAAPP